MGYCFGYTFVKVVCGKLIFFIIYFEIFYCYEILHVWVSANTCVPCLGTQKRASEPPELEV